MDTNTNFQADNTQQPVADGMFNPMFMPAAKKQKASKRRFSKLTAEEVANLPGVDPVLVKKVEQEISYYLFFFLPVSGGIGSLTETTQVHNFAHQLNTHATNKNAGTVTGISVSAGKFQVILELNSAGEHSSHGALINYAFAQLNEYLDAAPQLNPGPAGIAATWKAKVNGTTVAEGKY